MAKKPTDAEASAAIASGAEPKDVALWYVMDTTAEPDGVNASGQPISGARVHQQLIDGKIRSFKFENGKPLGMPAAIAFKFLKEPAFVRTDADGNEIAYDRAPKQPDELGAGERMVLKDNETIARLDELSNSALLQRAAVLPGGEKFAQGANKPERADMIAFIVAFRTATRKANTAKESDRGRDEFVPEAELDDEMAA